jgi:predicted HTH transcriptional regulator
MVTTSDLVDILGVTSRRIRKILGEMVDEGLLVAEGKNKGRFYRFP